MKKCAFVACPNPAAPRDHYCRPCAYWARVVLADPRYRTEPPPAPPRQGSLL